MADKDFSDHFLDAMAAIYQQFPSRRVVTGFCSSYMPVFCDVKTCGDPDMQAKEQQGLLNSSVDESTAELGIDGKASSPHSDEPIHTQPTASKKKGLVVKKAGMGSKAYRDALREKYGFEKPERSTRNSAMENNIKDLKKRGEALKNTEDAAGQLADEASSLSTIASKLKAKHQNRFLGLF